MTEKKILIFAGPNGAGKTTFASTFLPNEANCPIFIKADSIAASISPMSPETAAIKAGRLMLQQIKANVELGNSFAMETTLAGRAYVWLFRDWRQSGYTLKLYFLSLNSAEEAIRRVAERVEQGGHHIPDETVVRRFHAGLRLFNEVYKFEVNLWRWYDNSGTLPVLIDEGSNSEA